MGGWSRADAIAWRRRQDDLDRASLREGIGADEATLAEGRTVVLTERRMRVLIRRGHERDVLDVLLHGVHSWHVSWSHDGRPTIVLDHETVTRMEISRSRTILCFHLGGKPYEVDRSSTRVRFSGRRAPVYEASIDRLTSLGIPRGTDEQRALPGTRDERLGASVSPLLLVRSHRAYRRQVRRLSASDL